jgi:uncharacterized protein (TIGR03435 family)
MLFPLWKTLCLATLSSAFSLSFQSPGVPSFEVASVKASDPKLGMRAFPVRGGPGSADPGQVIYTNISLKYLLYYAYGAHSDQITGPEWLGTEHYDIVAKIPPGTGKEEFTLMLRTLLADRFHLALHHESKEVQGYDLAIGKNGPKLKEASEGDSLAAAQPPSGPPLLDKPDGKGYPQLARPGMIYPAVPGTNGLGIHLIARAQKLSDLAMVLSGNFGHPIVNRTGLEGRYDFTLDFALETNNPAGEASVDLPPPIPLALQEQLGLRLTPVKTAVDMLVIDRADKVPTAN